MFRSVVIAPDAEFAKAVERLAFDSHHLTVNKTIDALPASAYDITRIVTGYDPEIILLQNTAGDTALEVAENFRSTAPQVAVLALGGRLSPDMAQQYNAIGTVVLNGAFSQREFVLAIKAAIHRARQNTYGPIFAFLPGKAGSGATTIAFNVAAAMALTLQKKAFVLEADLHSGVMSALLDTKPRIPLIDALQNSDALDYSLWLKYVVSANSTDYLLADRSKKTPLPSWMHYHQLLRFVSTRYEGIIVDLPEVVNEATDEIVQAARATFVVCTPELASLTLARQRIEELRAHGAPDGRLRIVLNRWHKSDMKPEEVGKLLEHPVSFVVRNDYRAINKAYSSGQPVSPDSELGRSFVEFADKLLTGKQETTAPKSRFSLF